jgi:hypothetical protein
LREKVIGAKIFSDMIHGGRNFEPVLDDDDNYEEEYTDEDNEDVEEEKRCKVDRRRRGKKLIEDLGGRVSHRRVEGGEIFPHHRCQPKPWKVLQAHLQSVQ